MNKILFLVSMSIIIYTYIGYLAGLYILNFLHQKPVKKKDFQPHVTIIISVYNEGGVIEEKIFNCLNLDYPGDKIEILIGSDGSTDETNNILKKHVSQKVRTFIYDERRGKPSILNKLVPLAKGEIIFFTDARQSLQKDALKEIVNNFSDPSVGSVSGQLILMKINSSHIGGGLATYWDYEKLLRKYESGLGSMIGATGAIYAIRKELFVKLPADILLDDVFIPLKIVEKGFRAIFEPKALAYDKVSGTHQLEFERKVRTIYGNWQIFSLFKNMFNPFRSKIAIQLFSHKFLRLLVPYFLILLFFSNIFLLDDGRYKFIFALQVSFYSFALLGKLFVNLRPPILKIPYTFCLLYLAAIKGFYSFAFQKQTITWKR